MLSNTHIISIYENIEGFVDGERGEEWRRESNSLTPIVAHTNDVRTYARKVRSAAKWSRATLPLFSSTRLGFKDSNRFRQEERKDSSDEVLVVCCGWTC